MMSTVIHWPCSSTNHHFRHPQRLCFTQALFSQLIQSQKLAFKNVLIICAHSFAVDVMRKQSAKWSNGRCARACALSHSEFLIAASTSQFVRARSDRRSSADSRPAIFLNDDHARKQFGEMDERRWCVWLVATGKHAFIELHTCKTFLQDRLVRQWAIFEVPHPALKWPTYPSDRIWCSIHRSLFKDGLHPPKMRQK
jgi:hypothetical protein